MGSHPAAVTALKKKQEAEMAAKVVELPKSLQREVWRGRGGNAGVLDQVKPKALRERLLKVWAKW